MLHALKEYSSALACRLDTILPTAESASLLSLEIDRHALALEVFFCFPNGELAEVEYRGSKHRRGLSLTDGFHEMLELSAATGGDDGN